ncbi:related to mitochondrial outer membrane protein (Sam35) [Rhynchosporium secalis]|uniref:Related to mitochondrial outer membrane protein (Sam35) n=1 Tax=Rhynchosporium secalis TaxID=38038 RepID=A0A1E1M519_RHYSE|nr:related to mitochondrial outer membrane protein (Sam35) [Rhynchosporium secalis]
MPPKQPTEKSHTDDKVPNDGAQTPFARQTGRMKEIFSIPAPIKKLFDLVPVVVYPENPLPQRAPKSARIPSLYVFSRGQDASAGRPSVNPSCLKWQTYLNISGIDHRLISSNNHASPSGALPFLLPAARTGGSPETLLPVPSNKFVKYATEHGGKVEESNNMRYSAYQSLLDHRIRNAWLFTLYLEPLNFSAVAYPLYVAPASSNPIVRASISHQLRNAAESELLKNTPVIDTDDLYSEADKAFEALSILLGEDSWFFGNDKPALFDASVFAYSQLLLDDDLGWKEKKLCRALRVRDNLVQHRERLVVRYYGGS